MEISQIAIARLYFLAIIVGIGLGLLYDTFRISRVFLGARYSRWGENLQDRIHLPFLSPIKKHKRNPFLATVIFFEDFLFGILCGVAMILFFYMANNGSFRFPAIICTVGGFFLYRATLGKLVMMCSELIAFAIGVLIRYIVLFVTLPFRFVYQKTHSASKRAINHYKAKVQKKQRDRYTVEQTRKLEQNACGMIPKKDETKQNTLKRGHAYARKKEETVQSKHSDESLSRSHRRGLFGRVCK